MRRTPWGTGVFNSHIWEQVLETEPEFDLEDNLEVMSCAIAAIHLPWKSDVRA